MKTRKVNQHNKGKKRRSFNNRPYKLGELITAKTEVGCEFVQDNTTTVLECSGKLRL